MSEEATHDLEGKLIALKSYMTCLTYTLLTQGVLDEKAFRRDLKLMRERLAHTDYNGRSVPAFDEMFQGLLKDV